MADSLITRGRAALRAAVGVFTDDSVRQVYGMLSGIKPGGLGDPPLRTTRQFLKSYSEMPWLRAVGSRIAWGVASADWKLYVAQKKPAQTPKFGLSPYYRNVKLQRARGKTRRDLIKSAVERGDVKEIEDNPLLDVLHDANSFQTGLQMRKVTQIHMDLVGEAFWLKERDGVGKVIGVWPVPPDWVMNTPTPSVRAFRVGYRAWRGLIPDTEFVWFNDPDPSNPYARGSGTAQSLSDELETDEFTAKHIKGFFYNRAKPDIMVYPKQGVMRQPDVDRLQEDWVSQNAGFWQAFKPYFMTREVGVHEFDQDFRSMQLVQMRQQQRDAVLQTFGIPPELLGILENSNRATIDAADYLFAQHVLAPRLEMMRTVLQERLVPEFDERLIIDYENPVKEDEETQLKALTVAPWSASVDEWRKWGGLEPMDDEAEGQLHMIPTLVKPMLLADAAEEALKPPPAPIIAPGGPTPGHPAPNGPAGLTPQGDQKPPKSSHRGVQARSRGLLALGADLRKAAAECQRAGDPEGAADLYHADHMLDAALPPASEAARRAEPAFMRAVRAVWRGHAAAIDQAALDRACAAHDAEALEALVGPEALAAALRSLVVPALEESFMRGAEIGLAPVRAVKGVKAEDPLDFDLQGVNPAAVAYAQQQAAILVDAPAQTRARVRNLVARAIQEGITPDELAVLIRGVVGLTEAQVNAIANYRATLAERGGPTAARQAKVQRYVDAQRTRRAETIARTELIGALNEGQQAVWEDAARTGLLDADAVRRVWIVTDDELLEPECEELGDQDPVGLTEPFDDAGTMAPPLHPNCRCSIGLVSA